jgi:hypothetical protein
MNQLLLSAAAVATLAAGSAMAQTAYDPGRALSGPTIPQRQGINPDSVEARSPTFWTDPSRAGNLNNDDSRVTVVTTYTNPSARADAEFFTPAPFDEPAATPPASDVAFTDNEAVDIQPTFTDVAPLAAPPAPMMITEIIASSPVPDTAQNRARYGGPMSMSGRRTAARGN